MNARNRHGLDLVEWTPRGEKNAITPGKEEAVYHGVQSLVISILNGN